MRTATYRLGQRIWTITTPPPPSEETDSDGPLTLVEQPETPEVRNA